MYRAARCRLCLRANLSCIADRFTGTRQRHRKERRRCRRGLAQFAPLQCAAPLEHLVRVHTVRTSHQRHTRAGLECQLCNPPLLRHRPPPATGRRPVPTSCSSPMTASSSSHQAPCQRGTQDAYSKQCRTEREKDLRHSPFVLPGADGPNRVIDDLAEAKTSRRLTFSVVQNARGLSTPRRPFRACPSGHRLARRHGLRTRSANAKHPRNARRGCRQGREGCMRLGLVPVGR